MMLKRLKKPVVSSRRRSADSARPVTMTYRSNRTDQEYNTGRAQPRDQDVRRRELLIRFWRQRLGGLIAGLIILVCLLNVLRLSPNPKVIVLSSSSNSTFLRDTTVYQKAADKLFASSLLNGNKITVNTAEVQQKLQQEFPELSDVTVTLPLISHQPILYIAPTTPSVVLTTSQGSYILSATGVALLDANQLSATAKQQLPIIADQTNPPLTIGHEVLAGSTISFIQTVLAQLKVKGIAVDSLTLPATAAYELDLKPSGVGYFVKFNLHDASGAQQQAGTFLAVQQRLQSQGITPGSYIDVRLNGRAYYK